VVDAATLEAGRCSVEAHDRMCAACREQQRRDAIADRANEAASLSRRGGAPTLEETSTRETLIAWLQWCDPNGSHTDELAAKEEADPYTLATAWDAIAEMLDSNA